MLRNFLGLVFILLVISFSSVYSTTLIEGVDYNVIVSNSDKGIGWKEIEIYAMRTLNSGNHIIINNSLFNLSPNFELLFVKVFDQDINICSNPVMNNFFSLPNCIEPSTRDIYGHEYYILTLPERIDLFDTKTYDLVFGMDSRSELVTFNTRNSALNFNLTVNGSQLDESILNQYSDVISNVRTSGDLLDKSGTNLQFLSDGGLKNFHLRQEQNPHIVTSITNPSDCNINNNLDEFGGGTYFRCARDRDGRGDLILPSNFINELEREDIDFTLRRFLNRDRSWHNRFTDDLSVMVDFTVAGGSCSFDRCSDWWLFNNIYYWTQNTYIFTYENHPYCKEFPNTVIQIFDSLNNLTCLNSDLTLKLSSDEIEFDNRNIVENQIDFSIDFSEVYVNESTKIRYFFVKNESVPITNINLIPYQTNEEFANFVSFKDSLGSILWFNLYNLNQPLIIDNFENYIQNGENTIYLDQVNDEGGYWLFFDGQYNTPPEVLGLVEINTTLFTKITRATCFGGTYFDADGDIMQDEEYVWFRNGEIELISDTIDINTTSIQRGDIVYCGKRVFDGLEWSEWSNSTQYIVEPTPPTINMTITPIDPQPSDNLICSFNNYQDIDGDNLISYTLYWLNNETILNSSSSDMTVELSNSIMDSNAIYECRIQLNQLAQSFNFSQFATLVNIAPEITSVKTPIGTFSKQVYIEDFATGFDINNDDLFWTFQYSSDLINWNNIVVNSSSNTLNWNITNLADNMYYLRAKVNDGQLETNWSDIVSINIINFDVEHEIINSAYYTTQLSIESSSPSNMDQYSQGTVGTYCGDFNSEPAECYFYPPIRFDGNSNLYYIEINPYQFFESGQIYQSGFTQSIYDFMVYEVSNIGDIPTSSPIIRRTNNNLEVGTPNRINLNIVPNPNSYIAVKLCVNSNSNGDCGIIDNGGDDLIFIYTKNQGNFIMKTRQGLQPSLTQYDPYISFLWEDSISDNLQVELNRLHNDELLEPMIVKDSSGNTICVNEKLASFYPGVRSDCIENRGSSFTLIVNDISKSTQNEFEILWGKDISITNTFNDGLLRNANPISDVRMQIYGLSNPSGSTPSNVQLSVNSNQVWSYPSILNSRETINSVRNSFPNQLNTMLWSSSTPGRIIYHFEPLYIDFSVNVPNRIEPVNNGISPLQINISTNLQILPSLSYCKIEGNNISITTSTFIQSSVGVFRCEPSLEFTHNSGSYKWTVHIVDSNGQSRTTDGFFTYGSLEGITVTNLDFGSHVLENNTIDVESTLLVENTGNTLFNTFTIEVLEDKFWDSDSIYYFSYEDKIGFAPTRNQLRSPRFFNKLNLDDVNSLYNSTLHPGTSLETWWKLELDRTIKQGEYSTRWKLDKGSNN